MNKFTDLNNGKIIFIGKPFRSHDGFLLTERFMCVLEIDEDNNNILLLPMSTFHSEVIRKQKLTYKNVFEYAKIHGNNRDGYIKCNQIYSLSIDDFNNVKGIKVKHQMNQNHFRELQSHIENLQKDYKTKFLFKQIVFEDLVVAKQPEQNSESIFTDDELVRMQKIAQKNLKKIRKYEKVLKKVQQVAQAADEADNEFDDYERYS